MTNSNNRITDSELRTKMGQIPAYKVLKNLQQNATAAQPANIQQPASTFINTTMIIEELDKRCEDGNYHWHDYVADRGITNDVVYKPVRDHIKKTYNGTRDTIAGVIQWITDHGSLPTSIIDRVEQIIEASSVTFNFQQVPSGDFYGTKVYQIDQLQTLIYNHFRKYDLKPTSGEVGSALTTYLTDIPHKMIEMRANELAYDPSIDPSVWNAVGDVFDSSKQSTEFTVAILKKFIWQVKRKMRGIAVTDHLMPVVFGQQGTGKSYWLTNILYSPIIDMSLTDQTFKKLTEDRNAGQWAFLVHHFDEMAYADASDIETVKESITSAHKSYRPMGMNITASVRNMATMIGCSNKGDLSELIRDESGIRRFAPVYFSPLRWDQRPEWTVDPVLLWKTVDEDAPDPVQGQNLDQLRSLQKTQKFLSPFEMWLEYFEDDNAGETAKESYQALWSSCAAWAETTNTYMKKSNNANSFYKFLDAVLPERDGWKITKPQNKKTACFTGNASQVAPSQVVQFETLNDKLGRITADAKARMKSGE